MFKMYVSVVMMVIIIIPPRSHAHKERWRWNKMFVFRLGTLWWSCPDCTDPLPWLLYKACVVPSFFCRVYFIFTHEFLSAGCSQWPPRLAARVEEIFIFHPSVGTGKKCSEHIFKGPLTSRFAYSFTHKAQTQCRAPLNIGAPLAAASQWKKERNGKDGFRVPQQCVVSLCGWGEAGRTAGGRAAAAMKFWCVAGSAGCHSITPVSGKSSACEKRTWLERRAVWWTSWTEVCL